MENFLENFTEQEIAAYNSNKEYWADRAAKAQEILTSKGIKNTEKQLIKYYQQSMERVTGQFEKVYNKVLLNISEGATPTPADLYKLDSYWQMQGQIREELTKLGDKTGQTMSKSFMDHYRNAYRTAIQDGKNFSMISRETAEQMINQIWCADGQSWTNRIWKNVDKLQEALNESLLDCVLTGRPTEYLKERLVKEFGVAYNRADAIVRTEYAHIQTEAARNRYEDSGVEYVEIWADYDERRCDVCGKLHQKLYPVNAQMPIPAHPRCRCCILPVLKSTTEQLVIEGF